MHVTELFLLVCLMSRPAVRIVSVCLRRSDPAALSAKEIWVKYSTLCPLAIVCAKCWKTGSCLKVLALKAWEDAGWKLWPWA